ncbi:hypothetical protein FTX61_03475 [Nitriliruptoraceae bacterium ZYF776]|nr:hypothetical protein [Profundirhabdus halotolerans]
MSSFTIVRRGSSGARRGVRRAGVGGAPYAGSVHGRRRARGPGGANVPAVWPPTLAPPGGPARPRGWPTGQALRFLNASRPSALTVLNADGASAPEKRPYRAERPAPRGRRGSRGC